MQAMKYLNTASLMSHPCLYEMISRVVGTSLAISM